MNQRFKPRDTSPDYPGLIFWCYQRTKERWVTPERLEAERLKKNALANKNNARPEIKIKRAAYSKKRRLSPEFRQRESEYNHGRLAHVLERRKERYWTDPEYRKKRIQIVMAHHRKHPEQQKKAMDKWLSKPGNLEVKRQCYKNWVNKPEGRLVRRAVSARSRGTINGTIVNRLRSRIFHALEKWDTSKSASLTEIIGCSIADFKAHLERQFTEGMNWLNLGSWEIDHILPVTAFGDLSDPVAQRFAFNYRNCRPLWETENKSKNDLFDWSLVDKYELYDWIPYTTEEYKLAA